MTHDTLLLWGVIVVVGIGTFCLRASFVVLLHDRKQPQWFLQGLRYVAPAMLSTIVVSSLLNRNFTLEAGGIQRVLAALIATAVAYFSKSLFWTIISGMAALWLINYIVPMLS